MPDQGWREHELVSASRCTEEVHHANHNNYLHPAGFGCVRCGTSSSIAHNINDAGARHATAAHPRRTSDRACGSAAGHQRIGITSAVSATLNPTIKRYSIAADRSGDKLSKARWSCSQRMFAITVSSGSGAELE